MDTRVEKLAKELKMDKTELVNYINRLDFELQLGLDNYHELTRYQYDVVRGSLDIPYLAKRMKRIKAPGVKKGSSHDYTDTQGFTKLVYWISVTNLNNFSIADVKRLMPENLPHFGRQAIAAAMRQVGYEPKVVIIPETGKQGRRWSRVSLHKQPGTIEPSFL